MSLFLFCHVLNEPNAALTLQYRTNHFVEQRGNAKQSKTGHSPFVNRFKAAKHNDDNSAKEHVFLQLSSVAFTYMTIKLNSDLTKKTLRFTSLLFATSGPVDEVRNEYLDVKRLRSQ